MKSKTEQIAELLKKNNRLEDLLARKKVLHQDDYDKMLLFESKCFRLEKQRIDLQEELKVEKMLHEEYKVKAEKYGVKLDELKKSYETLDKMYDATHKLFKEEKRLKEAVTTHVTTLSNREQDFIRQLSKLEKTNKDLRLMSRETDNALIAEKKNCRSLESEISLTIDANTKLKERICELEMGYKLLSSMSVWNFIKWRKTQ